ncbi:hypothetical protein [Metasolibacillus sp. FSL K6-0083]|uniref:hypothetical protein n=1 Tax=Metasolibacillus sp. FSL K6-0083 TaxID=2921416 RepID=UPI00315AE82F
MTVPNEVKKVHINYIKYLQSLNNANSSNDNAIAESQFTNPFYEKIRVESNVGNYLVEKIKASPTFVFLTGHAGDGKTSLLHQVLRQFEAIKPGQILKEEDLVNTNYLDNSIYYIKDMSELNCEKQVESIKKGFENKGNGGSSIIVSNTGTLIDALKNYFKGSRYSNNEIEMDILKLMDENSFNEGIVGDQSILVINLALLDNTEIVSQLIDNILQEDLWSGVEECCLNDFCPIYNNYQILKIHQEKFKKMAISYYKWLAENDKRLTIRQILSHLSFAITGNVQCDKINVISKQRVLAEYHISNLFFGYVGTKKDKNAQKIKSIVEIQNLNLDEKRLPFDQELFVKENFSVLVPEIQNVAKVMWTNYTKSLLSDVSNSLYNEKAMTVRRAIRRMQILFSNSNEKQDELLLSSMYSPIYPKYISYTKDDLRGRSKRQLKEMIFKALQIVISGDSDPTLGSSVLYLPLKRSGLNNQNVYLLVGKVDYEDFEIVTEPVDNIISNEPKYKMYLKFNRIDDKQLITLPLLEYFYHIANGSLSTKLNPVLSHGINKLKSQLYNQYKYNDGEDMIKVLIKTLTGPRIIDIEVDTDSNKLYFK